MRQQINLLSPDLLTIRDWIDAKFMFLAAGLLIFSGTAAYVWLKYHVSRLDKESSETTAQLEFTKAKLATSLELRAPKNPDPTLLKKLKTAEDKLLYRQQMLSFLQNNTFERSKGPSRYMEAFASRTMTGLWLTEFSLDDTSSYIEINGRTVSPKLLAQYVDSLAQESVFKGRTFSSFELKTVSITETEWQKIMFPDKKEAHYAFFKKPNENQHVLNEFFIKSHLVQPEGTTSLIPQVNQ